MSVNEERQSANAKRESSSDELTTANNELRSALERAQRNEQRLQTLADAMPALIAYLDRSLTFRFFNRTHRDWFDIRDADLQGQHLERLLGSQHLQAIQRHCETALAGEQVTYRDYYEHQRLGTRTVQATHVPDHDDFDNVRGFYLLVTDITDLERFNEAAHASRLTSMSELAATVAHQLNQPLGAISSYAGALKREADDEHAARTRDIADKLMLQVHKASDTLAGLREFIDRRTFDQESLDLNQLVSRTLAVIDGRVQRAGARIDTALADDLPMLHGSPVQLEQMLINLCVNALEAVAECATRRLTVTTDYADDNVYISVRDTGPGIDPADADSIFETFVSYKSNGMGMGLAIARSVAEEHGGTIGLAPAEPCGAVFTVRLPVPGQPLG